MFVRITTQPMFLSCPGFLPDSPLFRKPFRPIFRRLNPYLPFSRVLYGKSIQCTFDLSTSKKQNFQPPAPQCRADAIRALVVQYVISSSEIQN